MVVLFCVSYKGGYGIRYYERLIFFYSYDFVIGIYSNFSMLEWSFDRVMCGEDFV